MTVRIAQWRLSIKPSHYILDGVGPIVIVFVILHLMHQLGLLFVALFCLLNQPVYVIWFIDIYQAEFLEIYIRSIVKIYQVVNFFVFWQRHGYAAKFKALNKLLELDLAVKIKVKVSEGNSVIFEFLFKSLMDLSQELLDFVIFFH